MGCCQGSSASQVEAAGSKPTKASKNKAPVSKDVIDKKVAQAKSTRALALRECGLKTLPAAAVEAEAANFRTVDLTSNNLKALPDTISCWTGVQSLLCSDNAITELPLTISQLASLQKLVLSSNKLSTLPREIALLPKVKVLQLDLNLIGPRLPADLFNGPLSESLEELDLTANVLEEVPTSVAGLSKLVRLVLARNRLKALPAELGALTKLQYLDAAENQLTVIPEAIIACPCLNELWLKGNPVERLQLQAMPGFAEFLERRKQRLDARIGANVVGRVDLSVCGLD